MPWLTRHLSLPGRCLRLDGQWNSSRCSEGRQNGRWSGQTWHLYIIISSLSRHDFVLHTYMHTHTHTHTFKSHFPGECSLASCPLIFIIQCLASGYASQHILSRSLSLEIETVAAGRASRVKISWGASLGLLSLSSAAGLLVAVQSEACERGPVINKRPHQSQT